MSKVAFGDIQPGQVFLVPVTLADVKYDVEVIKLASPIGAFLNTATWTIGALSDSQHGDSFECIGGILFEDR